MEFRLNEEQKEVVDLARDYANNYLADRVEEIEDADHFPEDLFQIMCDMGFLGLPYPEEYGGVEMGVLPLQMAIENVSRVSPSTGTLMCVCILPLDAIYLYGTEEQKKKYLTKGIRGDWKGSFAFTEPNTGSDPKMLKTIAVKTGEGKYKINGVKRFISNAAYEGPIVLFVKEKETEECTAFIVNKFCKGYSISTPWEKVGLHGSEIYDVFFDDVEVTEEDILGKHGQGFDILIGTTSYGKLGFSSVFTGSMEGARDLAVRYAKEKLVRGGKPISRFQSIQLKIAQIEANTLSAQLMLYKAAEDCDTIKDPAQIRKVQCSTALVKGYVADLATATNQMALNVLGAYGTTKEYKVERFVRDCVIGPNVEGAADIQRIIAASYILRN